MAQAYFGTKETFDIMNDIVWGIFSSQNVDALLTVIGPNNVDLKIKQLHVDVFLNDTYPIIASMFIQNQSKFVAKEDLQNFYNLLKTSKNKDVLKYFKTFVPTEKEESFDLLQLLDCAYSSSIAPVRFARTSEMITYIQDTLGYNEEVEGGIA